jgi:hypothetical protein
VRLCPFIHDQSDRLDKYAFHAPGTGVMGSSLSGSTGVCYRVIRKEILKQFEPQMLHWVAQLVEALRYMPEGPGFGSR